MFPLSGSTCPSFCVNMAGKCKESCGTGVRPSVMCDGFQQLPAHRWPQVTWGLKHSNRAKQWNSLTCSQLFICNI